MTHRAVVLIGPMGAGKSSIGRKVAKALGRTFRDTDAMIVRAHGPIPALFEAHGEAHFRAVEREAVSDALAAGGVIALGGGAVLDPATQEDLRAHLVVLLSVEERVVAARLSGGAGRPLLSGDEDPMQRWRRIADERRPLYERIADVTVDTSRGRIQHIVDRITAWVQERQDSDPAEQQEESQA